MAASHLQTTTNARYLFVRASRVDWRQNPHALLRATGGSARCPKDRRPDFRS
jgi:hypothetical protein